MLYKSTPFRFIYYRFLYMANGRALGLSVVNYAIHLFWRAVCSEATQTRCTGLMIAESHTQMARRVICHSFLPLFGGL
jgi:hypothetical protein